jgi:hypothetical protein
MQSWFSSSGEDQQQEKPPSSLLADWNSYAAKSDVNEYTNGLGSFGSFDLEASVALISKLLFALLTTPFLAPLMCKQKKLKDRIFIFND